MKNQQYLYISNTELTLLLLNGCSAGAIKQELNKLARSEQALVSKSRAQSLALLERLNKDSINLLGLSKPLIALERHIQTLYRRYKPKKLM